MEWLSNLEGAELQRRNALIRRANALGLAVYEQINGRFSIGFLDPRNEPDADHLVVFEEWNFDLDDVEACLMGAEGRSDAEVLQRFGMR